MYITHFGVKIKEKESNHISKAVYLAAKPEGMEHWEEEDYTNQRKRADINYDLNMEYFKSLDERDFSNYILKQCKKYKMTECINLNEVAGVAGIYMLVLDKYKQVYIGLSDDIKKRVMQHWRNQKSLERLIFGDICNSVISIDSFGAFDTTRIFYIKTYSQYTLEERILKSFDTRYTLNRTAGGIGSVDTYTGDQASAVLAVSANRRGKNLIQFVDIDRLKETVSEKSFEYYLERYPELIHKKQTV